MAAKVKVTQVRSQIGNKQNQRATLATLGLGKIGDEAVKTDGPAVRGMIATVSHLVTVQEVE